MNGNNIEFKGPMVRDIPNGRVVNVNNTNIPNLLHKNLDGTLDGLFKNHHIRVTCDGPDDNHVLFCGPDIANAFKYRPEHMYDLLLPEEKKDISLGSKDPDLLTGNSGGFIRTTGNTNTTFIYLPGLFRIIFNSRHPEAMVFQDWVFNVVLPSLAYHGYMASNNTMNILNNNPSIVADLNNQLSKIKNDYKKALDVATYYNKKAIKAEAENSRLTKELSENIQYTNLGKACYNNINNISINDFAKLMQNIITDRPFDEYEARSYLRRDGFLLSRNPNYNKPSDFSIDHGLMVLVANESDANLITMITPAGARYLINFYTDAYYRGVL